MPILELFGVIGWEVSLDSFSWRLRELREQFPTDTITVKINSPGGDCAVAWAIAHLIENDGNINTMNIGLAASAAGFIFQKGKRRLSASNSMTMMHRTHLDVSGDCTDLERMAAMLKEWDAEIIKVIADRTFITDETVINGLLEKPGWWQNSDHALENGVIDEIITAESKQPLPKNSVDYVTKNYANLPYNVLNQIITIPNNATEATMTPEETKALTDGIAAGFVSAIQPLADAINKLVEKEAAEPAETEAAQNAAAAIVTASIAPALQALNDASAAMKISNETVASAFEKMTAIPSPNNSAAPHIYGLGGEGADNSDEVANKTFA